ncbi:HAD-IIA family hydrolase [Alteribacillus sp. HJP-4]|uniref:HAD-IIA family hydrolase n=1 Tax=Alteribacillus sp. HJP-4 TaxID=2775394 RepID=UPI0035CD1AE3
MNLQLKNIQAFLIDIDGTVFTGNKPIEGAIDTLLHLQKLGMPLAFLSNRGNISRKEAQQKLKRAGLEVKQEEIILSSYVAADFLKSYYPSQTAWVFGEQGLADELEEAGIQLSTEPEKADWLVVSLHERLTYRDMNNAFRAVKHGARILATNSDRSFPREDGEAIDVAGMLGAIEATTNRRADVIVGKPSHYMAQKALQQLGITPERCAIVGDSLGSDIAMGRMFGLKTILVLTGGTSAKEVEGLDNAPDYIFPSITYLKDGGKL